MCTDFVNPILLFGIDIRKDKCLPTYIFEDKMKLDKVKITNNLRTHLSLGSMEARFRSKLLNYSRYVGN